MASFSNQVKTEICGSIRKQADCRIFLRGALLGVRRFTAEELVLQTECEAFAALLPQLMQSVSPKLQCDTEFRQRSGKQSVWCFTFSAADIALLTRTLQIEPENRAAALDGMTGKTLALLMAGCFVICGSVTDPERRYHLEMVMPDAGFGAALRQLLNDEQLGITLKSTVRKGDTVLYLKQNEQICDALTYFRAPNASMSLAEQQVYKSIRSQTNRRTNCDLANIDKALAAGAEQIADIRHIQETVGLSALPPVLQEIARLRLDEPEASLRELGAMLEPPLSRSGVNHRLQRISQFAKKLKE